MRDPICMLLSSSVMLVDVTLKTKSRPITQAQIGLHTSSFSLVRAHEYHRDFAANVGINFMTPEEYFLNEPSRPFTRSFEPSLHLLNVDDARGLTTSDDLGLMTASKPAVQIDVPSIVLFCGSPGIGKSTFYWKNFRPLGYERVNQDTLKTVRPPALVVVQSLS